MRPGQIIKNFELVEQIHTVEDFINELDTKPSLFWRHRVMPSSFFYNWRLRQLRYDINNGFFWKVKRIN